MLSSCSSIALLLILVVCGRAVALSSITPADNASFPPSEVTCDLHCSCHDRVLSCVGSSSFHLLKIPVVRSPNTTFNVLDFRSNRISAIEKGAWVSYPWTETLILRHNLLGRIHADAFEGLQLLRFLDLSCNNINVIEPRAFEPVSFLRHLDLSGNGINQIQNETFRTWHGLKYLTYVALARNPLEEVDSKSLFHLNSLEHLDASATTIPFKAVEDLMMILPHLEKAVLPLPITCCLCLAEMDIGKLSESLQVHCLSVCYANTFRCGDGKPPFEDHVFVRSLREHRRHYTNTLRIEPATSSGTCEGREREHSGSPITHPAKPGGKLALVTRATILTICAFVTTSVVGGICYLLRKVCSKSCTKEPQEIIGMEEGRGRQTETDQ